MLRVREDELFVAGGFFIPFKLSSKDHPASSFLFFRPENSTEETEGSESKASLREKSTVSST